MGSDEGALVVMCGRDEECLLTKHNDKLKNCDEECLLTKHNNKLKNRDEECLLTKHDNTLQNCIDMCMLEDYGHTHLLNTIFDFIIKGCNTVYMPPHVINKL